MFVLLIALAAAPIALAENSVSVDAGDFAAQRAKIEKDLADGKTYAELSSAERSDVRASLDRMASMLEGGKTPDELSADRKVELYNVQERTNMLLTQGAADSRLVCTREARTGSRREITTCMTVAERNRRRTADQDTMQKAQRITLPVRN
ncbi:hypothetical protein [Arenimonas sp.]|uniref:hypothetical protein n=1 Tax=Arenimonas sp. TaxID=1872635 RepID=UPI0025BD8310|nr:hypothetical protein [Arenimonas sp.]